MNPFGTILRIMSRFSKKMIEIIELLLTGKGTLADEFVNAGILNYNGQGKDEYGK